ncbi:MAG: MoaD/ThiS family protein, partial [Anaerolineae bacterium]|nr:MoaD/ThiS family protein [Anaerolineae bacterium]
MMTISVDVWLYGELARYGGDPDERTFANRMVALAPGSTLRNLLDYLKMPTEARGITFINGDLSA